MFLSIKQLADLLGLHKSNIYARLERGRFVGARIARQRRCRRAKDFASRSGQRYRRPIHIASKSYRSPALRKVFRAVKP